MKPREILDNFRVAIYLRKKEQKNIERLLLTCSNPERIVDKLDEYNLFLFHLDKRIYLRKIEGYYNLYDYMLKKGPIHPKPEDWVEKELVIAWIMNKKTFPNENYSNELLLDYLPDGTRIIDFALENNMFSFYPPHINNIEVAKIFATKGKYEFLENCVSAIYDEPINEKETVLECMIKHRIIPNIKFIKSKEESLFHFFNSIEKEDCLFKKLQNGKTVLETLLASDLPFMFQFNQFTYEQEKDTWRRIIETCYYRNKLDKLSDLPEVALDMDILTQEERTIKTIDLLDWDNISPNIKFRITKGSIVKYLVLKKDFLTLCNLATPEILGDYELVEGANALDFMISTLISENRIVPSLEENSFCLRDATSILVRDGKITPKISLTYAKFGFYLPTTKPNIELGITSSDQIEKYLYKSVVISPDKDSEALVNQFREIYNDEKSSPEVVELIIASFLESFATDRQNATRDLQALIDIKKLNPSFQLEYDLNDGASFCPPSSISDGFGGYLRVKNKYDQSTLDHEWGHAIHYIYGENKLPADIEKLLPYDCNYIFQDMNSYQTTYKLCCEMDEAAQTLNDEQEIEKDFLRFIEISKGGIEKYKEEIRAEFRELFGTAKILLEAINCGKYSNEVLLALSKAYFEHETNDKEKIIESYVTARIKAEYETFKKKKFVKNNTEFLCYENFLDAYLGGALGNHMQNVKTHAPSSTHNVLYFRTKEIQFQELFANYVELRKMPSPDREKYMAKIKERTSPELIDALENYYLSLTNEKRKTL